MINDFEKYHGVAIRELITSAAPKAVSIRVHDPYGRVNSYVLNDHIGFHIKHSSKRLPPWQFTFDNENCGELDFLGSASDDVWIALVCGPDGVVCITYADFLSINPRGCEATAFVRVDRDKRSMYRVRGSECVLGGAKPRGFHRLVSLL